MKLSRTTIAGAAAGTFYASAQIPELNTHLALALKLLAAVAIAALGAHAKDCPTNCLAETSKADRALGSACLFAPLAAVIVLAVPMSFTQGCTRPTQSRTKPAVNLLYIDEPTARSR